MRHHVHVTQAWRVRQLNEDHVIMSLLQTPESSLGLRFPLPSFINFTPYPPAVWLVF